MRYYLAYGSNLNLEQMSFRCPDARAVGSAEIHGWQLAFRRGYLTIEPADGSTVPVGIWEINDRDEKNLDRYEGFPKFYRKEFLDVEFLGRSLPCMVYIMNDGHPIRKPSPEYLLTVAKGYSDFGMGMVPLVEAYDRANTTVSTTINDQN